jgi:predicted ribonuclease YlaK
MTKLKKMDMRFDTWNVRTRNTYRAISLMAFAKEILKYVTLSGIKGGQMG